MAEQDISYLLKYPFTEHARKFVQEMGLSFEELMSHPIYSASLERGSQRLIDLLENKKGPDTSYKSDGEAKLAILSYPIARMLAHSMGRGVAQRYARGESSHMLEVMRREDEQILEDLYSQLGIGYAGKDMDYKDYVRLTSNLSKDNPRYRLVNRSMKSGRVRVDEDELKVLAKEAIYNRILEPVDVKKIPKKVRDEASRIKPEIAHDELSVDAKDLEQKALPPCVIKITQDLSTGQVSHNGMFYIATFYSNLGLTKEDIHNVFKAMPNYDREKADYQLRFLTGESGGTKYTCPTCATVRSQGLCIAKCGTKHPLQFYRSRSRRWKVKKGKNK